MTLLILAASLAVAQDACPERTVWPADDWVDATEEHAAAHADAVKALEDYAFPGTDFSDRKREGIRTEGVVVIHQGRLIYEHYANGYDRDKKHLTWSVTKTFTNALTGIAVREGHVRETDSICQHLSGIEGESCDITLANLLEFSSGFEWAETYEDASPTNSSVLAMLYGEGSGDMARFVAGHPLRDPPGTTFMYSSGDSTLLAGVVGAAVAPTHGEKWPWAMLFDPIGMTDVTFERDRSGTYVGSSWLWAPPRQLARFGYLLLNDGCWEGNRLLPEGWVSTSTQPAEPIRTKNLDGGGVNGRQIWLNVPVPETGQPTRAWPDVPESAYAALGHWKQSIFVAPEQDLVVVRMGDDRDDTFDRNRFYTLALALVEE
jgi:CubicO group peptidase (beta-lactamase class C family)